MIVVGSSVPFGTYSNSKEVLQKVLCSSEGTKTRLWIVRSTEGMTSTVVPFRTKVDLYIDIKVHLRLYKNELHKVVVPCVGALGHNERTVNLGC